MRLPAESWVPNGQCNRVEKWFLTPKAAVGVWKMWLGLDVRCLVILLMVLLIIERAYAMSLRIWM